MPGLTRQQLSQIFRPVGPKQIAVGNSPLGFVATAMGGTVNLSQAVDLSLPIRGFRLVFKGRLVVGTANFTSVNPESFLNLLSRILITGTNSRQKGNVTLWDIDCATLFNIQHLIGFRTGSFNVNGTELAIPDTPFPPLTPALTVGTYDWRIVVDLPAYPFDAPPGVKPQFIIRNEEWKDTLQMQFTFGTQAGNATGALGVAGATTTVTFSSFGSGAGAPTLDVYSLPVVMGLDLKDQFLPGFLTRVSQPITTQLQTAGPLTTTLLNLQKQPTTRIFFKVGTSTFPNGNPAFATLSDTNVTTLGLALGGNRNVRNNLDIFTHKQEIVEAYQTHGMIQGYNLLDFVPSGNPDSAYPGDLVGDGTTFQLQGTVAGVANGAGIVIQEQALYSAEGPLYSF
jgi:hypothetical protein